MSCDITDLPLLKVWWIVMAPEWENWRGVIKNKNIDS